MQILGINLRENSRVQQVQIDGQPQQQQLLNRVLKNISVGIHHEDILQSQRRSHHFLVHLPCK